MKLKLLLDQGLAPVAAVLLRESLVILAYAREAGMVRRMPLRS